MENRKPIFRSLGFFGTALAVTVLTGIAESRAQAPEPQASRQQAKPAGLHTPAQQESAALVQERAFVKQYCVTCHSDKLHTAGLSLESVNFSDVTQNGDVLEKVVRKLSTGSMPPASAPKPEKAKVNAFLSSLETSLDLASAAHPNPGRPMMLHRLNRTEYLNATRDLLGVELSPEDASLLPPDDTSYGFDNNGDVLGLSPLLLERYLSVARHTTMAALGPTSGVDVDVYSHHVDFLVPQREWIEGLPLGTRGGTTFTYQFPIDGEYAIKVKLQRQYNRILGLDDYDEGVPARSQRVEIGLDGVPVGLFSVNVGSTVKESLSLSPQELLNQPDAPAKKMTKVETDKREDTADDGLEVRLSVKAGKRTIFATFLARFEPVSDQLQEPKVSGQGGPPRLLAVDSVTITGPFKTEGSVDLVSQSRIITCRPKSATDEMACAKSILGPLAHRAYRRPVTGSEYDELLTAFAQGRKDSSFEAGIATAIRRMLMDPEFLFRVERDPSKATPNTPYRLTDLELASRLSFFMWSSIPDDQLLALAEKGQLKDPVVLKAQVRRMLADPRAQTLVTNFGAQWLGLRQLGGVHPDPIIFSDFDTGLRQAFSRETELLLQNVLLGDRNVLELLNANYTFVNERLARHYGIPGVYGDEFRRVETTDGVRGGLLGQGSILTVTSYPNRTSPVLRGKWILDTLLGSPPPPPPPDVPPLPEAEATGKVLSVRERLSEHRKNAACASCHARMDPLGFALENYDATGRWRTAEAAGPADLTPQPIDASGELTDGSKFDGVAGLKRVLQERSDQFVYAMTEKLFIYALGRGTDWYDAPAIREALRAAKKDDYHFSALVASIVTSPEFRMRMSQEPEESLKNAPQPSKASAGVPKTDRKQI